MLVSFVGGLTEPTLYAAPRIKNPLPFRTSENVTGMFLGIAFVGLIGCLIVSVVVLIRRFRRSTGDQHE